MNSLQLRDEIARCRLEVFSYLERTNPQLPVTELEFLREYLRAGILTYEAGHVFRLKTIIETRKHFEKLLQVGTFFYPRELKIAATFKNLDLENTHFVSEAGGRYNYDFCSYYRHCFFRNCSFSTCSDPMRIVLYRELSKQKHPTFGLEHLAFTMQWNEIKRFFGYYQYKRLEKVFNEAIETVFSENLPVPNIYFGYPLPPPYDELKGSFSHDLQPQVDLVASREKQLRGIS